MLRKLIFSTVLAIPLIPLGGCADPDRPGDELVDPDAPDLSRGDDFVALPRVVDRETAAARRTALAKAGAPVRTTNRIAADRDFYIGVRKSALADRYFMTAFLEQYFPGAVMGGAASSLGTRVISFKIQNGKLFVFDASDRHAATEVFDPEILVEAYPIVDNAYTRSIPLSDRYVFFDPAAGVAGFDFLRDAFGSAWSQVSFDRELAFNQKFERLADGVSFQQVFAGTADVPISDGQVEPDVFRAAGTLGISIRRYQEGAHYQEVALPDPEHYFRSDPKHVVGTPDPVQTAAHWDIHRGMRPIEWVISPEVKALDDTAEYADVELVAAVEQGIETWNQAFGFEVFRARLATADESFGQDDKNYIIFDPDPSVGFAFANWRTNPNTGEIRGASVYFGGAWVGRGGIEDDPPAGGRTPPQQPSRPAVRSLRWAGMYAAPLCVSWHDDRGVGHADDNTSYTAGEKLERSISDMIAHEIGHDLGLRHNFAGSLVEPTSSSVMDYTLFTTAVAMGGAVGSYDVDAVEYLYGLSPELPTQPFCTDEDVGVIPECQRFDTGADPFATTYQPDYEWIRDYFTRFGLPEQFLWALEAYGRPVYDFAANGDGAQAERGWELLMLDVGAPIAAATLADPGFIPSGADLVLRSTLTTAVNEPNPAIIEQVEDQLSLVLANVDGVRSARSRRTAVDLLKLRQNNRSYGKLLAARDVIAGELAGGAISADAALDARDLLARIDRATSPYYE